MIFIFVFPAILCLNVLRLKAFLHPPSSPSARRRSWFALISVLLPIPPPASSWFGSTFRFRAAGPHFTSPPPPTRSAAILVPARTDEPRYPPPAPLSVRWCNSRYCDFLLLLLCMIETMLFMGWRFSMYTNIIYPDHENSVTFLHVLCGLLLLSCPGCLKPSIWKRTPPRPLGVLARSLLLSADHVIAVGRRDPPV